VGRSRGDAACLVPHCRRCRRGLSRGTGDVADRGHIDACLQALRDSRLPARLYPGYWDNLARCCGTAGVGQLLLDRYQTTGDTALLEWADNLAADVASRALLTPQGVTWSNTEHTRTPPELPPEPGFMQGAAGIAGWLARLHAFHARPGTPSAPPAHHGFDGTQPGPRGIRAATGNPDTGTRLTTPAAASPSITSTLTRSVFCRRRLGARFQVRALRVPSMSAGSQ
jgi:hypothetical protein